ncbi:MAG: DUF5104 domain-containing protein [Ruminococcus sp.]|nr:DUF5104 domain-containing protein [Ruminococcus sp.]
MTLAKRLLAVAICAAMSLCAGCGVVDKIKETVGLSSLSSDTDEYKIKNQNKLCIKAAEDAFEAIKKHDTQALKAMFCQKTTNSGNLDEEIEKMYEFFDGEVESYDRISDPETGESTIDGVVERLNGNPYIKAVKTSNGHEYDICVQVVLIYKDAEWEGITQLGIHDKANDGYLRVGKAFEYE